MKTGVMKMLAAILLLLTAQTVSAELEGDRKELHDLLVVRQSKFETYAASLERKSGIFGNKTKADIRKSNEVLLEIVDLDNKIIRSLNRVVDFRNFEKVTMNYDLRDRDERLDALVRAVDTLSQRSDRLAAQNKALNNKLSGRTVLVYFLGLLALVLFAWSRRRR